jgi:hypothetical protein
MEWRLKRLRLLWSARLGASGSAADREWERRRSLTSVQEREHKVVSVPARRSWQAAGMSMADVMVGGAGGRGERSPVRGRRGGHVLGLRENWA